jgi:hypothetical protein
VVVHDDAAVGRQVLRVPVDQVAVGRWIGSRRQGEVGGAILVRAAHVVVVGHPARDQVGHRLGGMGLHEGDGFGDRAQEAQQALPVRLDARPRGGNHGQRVGRAAEVVQHVHAVGH